MNDVTAWVLSKLQGRCKHHPSDVTADILEGCDKEYMLQWCRICGAHQFVQIVGGPAAARALGWRRPQPTWDRHAD